jgi:chromosome partitioning protein
MSDKEIRLVLVCNEKGGVGKTTLAINIATMCSQAGKETLLVDTDPQESSADWSSVRDAIEFNPMLTCAQKRGKVGYDLAKMKEKYDMVVVDAGGRDSIEMRQAMAVCDICVIPIKPAQFDVWSLSKMAKIVTDVMEQTGEPVNAFTVINGASPNPMVQETIEVKETLRDYSDVFPLMNTVIAERIAVRHASRKGLSVIELRSPQADHKANFEMLSLYQEIFNEQWAKADAKAGQNAA